MRSPSDNQQWISRDHPALTCKHTPTRTWQSQYIISKRTYEGLWGGQCASSPLLPAGPLKHRSQRGGLIVSRSTALNGWLRRSSLSSPLFIHAVDDASLLSFFLFTWTAHTSTTLAIFFLPLSVPTYLSLSLLLSLPFSFALAELFSLSFFFYCAQPPVSGIWSIGSDGEHRQIRASGVLFDGGNCAIARERDCAGSQYCRLVLCFERLLLSTDDNSLLISTLILRLFYLETFLSTLHSIGFLLWSVICVLLRYKRILC